MYSFEERKRLRLDADVNAEVSPKTYNLVMGGVVIYGLVMNAIMCMLHLEYIIAESPQLFFLMYFVLCISGIFLSVKSDSPVVSFAGYNMIVLPIGILLSYSVNYYLEMDSSIVMLAFLYTAIITICMTTLGVVSADSFLSLGRILFGVLVGLILCEVVTLLMGIDQMITTWIAVVLFSLYIAYDFARAQQFPKTIDNAVDCAIDLYLDIINLFIRILSILGNSKRND